MQVRPGAKEFLEHLAPFYEMVIYTASLSKYADPLMDILDPKIICTARLFREHCTFYNGIFVKDLSKIDRDARDLLILDNSPNSYLFQPESALPIVSWYDDMNDTLLYDYIPILQGLSIVDDVREALATFTYPNAPMEYDRVDIDKAIEIFTPYIKKAREALLPEYESKTRTRIFSEPRNLQTQNQLDETQDEELTDSKTFKGPIQLRNHALNYQNNTAKPMNDATEMTDDVSAMVPSRGVVFNQSNAFKKMNNDQNNPQLNNFNRDSSNTRRKISTDGK